MGQLEQRPGINSGKWKSNIAIFLYYFTGGKGGEFDTYRNPEQYDKREYGSLYRRDNLARGVVDVLEDSLPYGNNTKILDVGAGTGILSLEIARRGCPSVIALDLFPLPLARLVKKAQAEGLGSQVVPIQVDMNDSFPFEDNSFGAVSSLRATRYINNFHNWLSEIRRVLKPEGSFVLPVFTIDAIPWKRHSNKGIYQPTSFRGVKKTVENSGFRIINQTNTKYEQAVDLTRGNRDVPFYYKPTFIVAQKYE